MKNSKSMIRLSLMMFMQYFLFAVWWVPFAAYLNNRLQLDMNQVSLILCAMAIGSMASPFIGLVADRRWPAQRVLSVLNLLTAVFLFLAAMQTSFVGLMGCVMLVMVCYMPTWSLISSIAMTHVPAEQFSRMRLMGTIGWVASGLFSIAAIHLFKADAFDGTALPMYCGAGAALAAAGLNLTLPDTPPSGKAAAGKISIADILGLRTLSVLRNPSYNRFILLSFLAVIPFTLYHVYGSMFFADQQVRNITVTMNWGQVVEIVFLFVTTSILIKCGFRKTLLFGLAAMVLRYLSFWLGIQLDQQGWYSIGVLSHGIIFGLFFVGGQVYTDKVAPPEIRAQAQGFLAFIVWGVGYLIGTLGNGFMIGSFRSGGMTDWGLLFLVSALFTLVLAVVLFLLFKPSERIEKTN